VVVTAANQADAKVLPHLLPEKKPRYGAIRAMWGRRR